MSEESKNLMMREKLRITVYAPGMPFDAETLATRSLGGSESAALYLARELARMGHEVAVFTSHPQPKSADDGVTFIYHGERNQTTPLGAQFEHYATNTPHDLLIAQRSPHIFHKQFAAKVCVWQLHDLALHRSAPALLGGSWQVDAITCVSEWHAAQVKEVWNINPDVLRVVPNGVDPHLYAPSDALGLALGVEGPWGKFTEERIAGKGKETFVRVPAGKFLILYQSRPERGLNYYLDLAEKCALVGLPLHFLACSYDNPVAHMEPMYEAVYARANAMKNVTLLGALSKPELAALQKRCDLLLYPTEFEEVSCISAMEAMHAGLPMLTSAVGALPETCSAIGTSLIPLKEGKADLEGFFTQLSVWFGFSADNGTYPPELNLMRGAQLVAAKHKTWRLAAERLMEVFCEARTKRQSSPAAILRHAVEHSDIRFADWYLRTRCERLVDTPDHSTINGDAIVLKTHDEITRLYRFIAGETAYAAHYAHHQGAYYDGPGANVVGEDVTGTTRFRGVIQFLAEHVQRTRDVGPRVLDYGCAHGHYTMPLAKAFKDATFVGLDISTRAIEKAREWAKRDELDNVEFRVGNQDSLRCAMEWEAQKNIEVPVTDDDFGTFDVIIAGEVLEHVWDYRALLDAFRARLAPGGVIIVTTPLGRWEHSGTEAFRTGREHLHHFDRADIEDIGRGHELSIMHAPAGHDRSGFQLSSFVWSLRPTPGISIHEVDYERKLRQLVPIRQTVTACIIAKNAQSTLRRCVESFVDWVDEVVIAVDAADDGQTYGIVAALAVQFPNRPIRSIAGACALKEGFDTARNRSIDAACGDWILWIDCDEELRNPGQLHKFLKPSMHNGYGWPQVHYSVDPEQVLTTDYPCRLFRNRMGIKFYGRIHEHPELEISKAVPWSLVRPEMKFLHHGYYDEETRQARFRRNFPLLKRDVEEHPQDRPLNKYLLLRDTAQSIQFELIATGGQMLPHHEAEAWRGINLMKEILEMPQPKMIADSIQYYSMCVSSLGIGFEGDVTVKTRHPMAPDLAASFNINGRWHSGEFYAKVVNRFTKESITHYDDPHL